MKQSVRPELLSPAGDYESFLAAVNAGADAVYLGLSRFGARANAANLSCEELKTALETAHIHDKKIYLTVNTLLRDDEIDDLYDLLAEPYRNGLDGVIVQDIGVMDRIHDLFPKLPIHVSTQAAVTSPAACVLLRSLGVTRLVPARELSVDEIRQLAKESGLEIECFIHGSLCYSYSGKCLLSSFIGGRSGNRGRCAQPCRLKYDDSYPLSLKDLCTIDMIPELIEAGISSFKIEGRMKSSGYVYGVTSIYRKYIDMYYDSVKYTVDEDDRRKLLSLYTRSGNCNGYYKCHNGKHMITPQSPAYESSDDTAGSKEITQIPTIPVNICCELRADKPAVISVYNDKYNIIIETGIIPEQARQNGTSYDEVKLQLSRCGGTEFAADDISISMDDGIFVPKSGLNSIRRTGLGAFRQEIVSAYHRQYGEKNSDQKIYPEETDHISSLSPAVNVSVLSEKQLKAALSTKADGIVIPMGLFMDVCMGGSYDFRGKRIFVSLPYVVREENGRNSCEEITGFIRRVTADHDITGFYVSNLESVAIIKNTGYKGMITGDIYIYAYNRYAYDQIKKFGVTKTSVPAELNIRELSDRGITGEELVIYGRSPVMVSANCIYNTENGCQKAVPGHSLYLTDRKGEKLFVYCDCSVCTNVIYNSAILSISDEKGLFEMIRPSSVRLAFTDEDPSEIRRITDLYMEKRQKSGYTAEKLIERYTKGHIRRGVD